MRARDMVADNGKKSKTAESAEEEDSNHIDAELVLSIEKLHDIQVELEKVNEEASDKVLQVEQKYNEIRKPVYIRRNQIIQSIPHFWLTAFLSYPPLGDLLTAADENVFMYLVSLDVEDFKDMKSGYSITFTFSPNPFFEDTKLTKSFSLSNEGTTNITGTAIKWKEGVDFANGTAHEKKGTKRPLLEESFFNWFSETQEKNVSEGMTDEVADMIKEDLWPNPLKYFYNEADEEIEEEEDEEEENDSDDEDGEQDDEEQDDEDDCVYSEDDCLYLFP